MHTFCNDIRGWLVGYYTNETYGPQWHTVARCKTALTAAMVCGFLNGSGFPPQTWVGVDWIGQ